MAGQEQKREDGFRLTGAHVLALLIAFFGIVFTVNGYLIYQSQRSFTGMMQGNGYEASLKYNQQAARARALLAKGWHTKVLVLRDRRIAVQLSDANGEPVTGLQATALLARPVGTQDDRVIMLTERAVGRYETAEAVPLGKWIIDIRFERRGELQWRATADFLVR